MKPVPGDMKPDSEPLIQRLQVVIRLCVRVMAILMVFVIVLGVVDVGWVIWQKMMAPPRFMMTIADILATFGAFMAVPIAIEIFINITIYLREDIIHVKIVIATALMAVARKVIVLDTSVIEPGYLFGIAGIVLALGITYWLVSSKART